jgi:hypothetical protein
VSAATVWELEIRCVTADPVIDASAVVVLPATG